MKCPKCHYLGFESGDRCKNCGYDFSLIDAHRAPEPADLPLREPEPPAAASRRAPAASLPLFQPPGARDDEPLIKVPAAPRPPLAVRRTPESARLRAAARPKSRASVAAPADGAPILRVAESAAAVRRPEAAPRREAAAAAPAPPARRLAAAALDHALLLGVDGLVVYFTLKMAALPASEWTVLPPLPFITFLLVIKLAYFSTFTAVGGQTVGKMAFGLRVVDARGGTPDAADAMQRTLLALLSIAGLGLGLLPIALTPDRRALHDRVARTRVITLSSSPAPRAAAGAEYARSTT